MPILWLRFALMCYSVGLLYALLALTQRSNVLHRIALPAMAAGMIFQFVSLTEAVLLAGQITLATVHNSESLLALLVMSAFMLVYAIYHTSSPGIVVFPLVFILTFVAATGQKPFLVNSPGLVQERSLKSKHPNRTRLRLPPLETIDEIGFRSLLLGFPSMTLGLIAGIVVA